MFNISLMHAFLVIPLPATVVSGIVFTGSLGEKYEAQLARRVLH